MPDRSVVKKTYLTEPEAAQLSEWSDETGKSESHLLREAVREYLDRDRGARIEDRLDRIEGKIDDLAPTLADGDAHTHKPESTMSTGSSASERARDIIRRLQSNNAEVVKDADVVRAIEDIAGIDDRTIRKYKDIFRRRGLLFEHPGEQAVWTFVVDDWLSWLREYASLNGAGAVEAIIDPYPADIYATGEGYRIEANEDEIEASV